MQVDVDTHSESPEVYNALKKLLKSSSKQSHIVCDGATLSEANACALIRAGSVVQVRPGHAPPAGSAPAPGLPPLVTVASTGVNKYGGGGARMTARKTQPGAPGAMKSEGSGFWLPSQHLGPAAAGLHGAKASHGSRGPKAMPGVAGADFGTTRRSSAGGGEYNSDPAAVTSASMGITVPGMDSVTQEDLALEDLSTWMDSYQSEMVSFSSSALNAELRYEEVLRSTAALGSPNAVRTRVVCQLLDAVVMRFGRFQRITQRLLHDVFSSVFVDPDAPNAVPYFLKFGRVQNQLVELRSKHELLLKDMNGEEGRSNARWAGAYTRPLLGST